jgi:hypothetical protein
MFTDFHVIREQIIARIRISELAKEYGLELKGHEIWKVSKCPWHSDSHPSLGFHDLFGTFRCFAAGCACKGSLFDLVSLYASLILVFSTVGCLKIQIKKRVFL